VAAALHQRPDGGLAEGSCDEVAAMEATGARGLTWETEWRSSVPTFIYLSVRVQRQRPAASAYPAVKTLHGRRDKAPQRVRPGFRVLPLQRSFLELLQVAHTDRYPV